MKRLNASADNAAARTKQPHKTDCTKYLTPYQIAQRWAMHRESVRRIIRQGRMASIVISRRRLVAISEIERIESEGLIARNF